MKFLLLLLIVVQIFSANQGITKEFVEKLKNIATWEVQEYEDNIFKGWTEEEFRSILTLRLTSQNSHTELPSHEEVEVPDNFDPRDKWPNCIHPIKDQAKCGSCWAFGLTETISDRFCIAGKDVILAPQDPISCDHTDHGCLGGYIDRAWTYATSTGIVSDACFPYESKSGSVPACPFKCTGTGDWIKYQCKQGTVFNAVDNNAKMNELYNNGPLENGFLVYKDFMAYKSGVYYHVSGGLEGGHATKTLGWGIDSKTGLHYWLVANSWGSSWGMNGFFMIKQGDCQIDENGWGCTPLI